MGNYTGLYGDYIGAILGLCVGLYKDYTLDMRSYSCSIGDYVGFRGSGVSGCLGWVWGRGYTHRNSPQL